MCNFLKLTFKQFNNITKFVDKYIVKYIYYILSHKNHRETSLISWMKWHNNSLFRFH